MDIRTSVSAVVLALALATPSLAQQTGSARDFRLPPDPDATPTPEVQGPVDPEAEVRTTPRVIPTDTPTTSAPSPSPTPTATPTPTLPPSRAAPTRPAPADTPRPQPQRVPEAAPTATPSPTPSPADEPAPQPTEFTPSIPPAASVPATTTAQPPESGSSIMIWLAALIAALGIAGGAFWYLRRREALAPVPVIEPPLVRRETPPPQPDSPAPTPAPSGTAAARPAPPPPLPGKTLAAPVTLHALPVRLSKSMMNATFAFQLVLENQGAERWEGVAVEADLVTAHGAAPIGEQVADPATALAPLSTLEALEPGDTRELAGEVRLPLGQVRAIPQGRAAVYVPLLRVRLTAKGRQPIARTFLIGQLPDRQGGRLRPFRLDEMPQSYDAIGLRPLD